MGIFKELGDSKIYDYSLQETLVDCLSDETVYVYLSLLASNQDKNKIEVLAPAGLLSQEVLPNKTALIRRKNLDELLKLDILICCVVAKHHWTLTIIKPKEKSFYYINPLGEILSSIKKEEIKWNNYLKQRYGISETYKIMTLPHALQRDSISCGVFCLKVM
ncbi:uncharacterized protein LOC124818694 [Hydra vulgaris]|uniref:uncharacterized protein LOC124818694 n=1 Tax=Hydra vulgaris TaxID=6087 RepID=UPI001F5E8A87|nr:uncharacterized protein LOC124818694 isoform X1 [Hydra vulgaris]